MSCHVCLVFFKCVINLTSFLFKSKFISFPISDSAHLLSHYYYCYNYYFCYYLLLIYVYIYLKDILYLIYIYIYIYVYILQIFVCFIFTFCLKILQWLLFFNQFVCFISCDGDFSTLRSTMKLQIPHGFLKRSALKVSETISKSQYRRFQSKWRCYWKFKFWCLIYGNCNRKMTL